MLAFYLRIYRKPLTMHESGAVDCVCGRDKLVLVSASQIIEEIKRLDPKEQLGVIRFAYQLDAERTLTGSELSSLAERMVTMTDAVEAARVRETIVRELYGQRHDALDSAAEQNRADI